MIDIARNIVPCSDKQDMKSRNGSYFQPSFSTRKRQRISSDLFSELPQKRSKTTNGRIWNKATYSFSSQILCTISSKVIRMWASFSIFGLFQFNDDSNNDSHVLTILLCLASQLYDTKSYCLSLTVLSFPFGRSTLSGQLDTELSLLVHLSVGYR